MSAGLFSCCLICASTVTSPVTRAFSSACEVGLSPAGAPFGFVDLSVDARDVLFVLDLAFFDFLAHRRDDVRVALFAVAFFHFGAHFDGTIVGSSLARRVLPGPGWADPVSPLVTPACTSVPRTGVLTSTETSLG